MGTGHGVQVGWDEAGVPLLWAQDSALRSELEAAPAGTNSSL